MANYRNRIKNINKSVSDYLDGGGQKNSKPYTQKRKKLPTDINKLSAPPGALEESEEQEEANLTELETMLEAWRQYIDENGIL